MRPAGPGGDFPLDRDVVVVSLIGILMENCKGRDAKGIWGCWWGLAQPKWGKCLCKPLSGLFEGSISAADLCQIPHPKVLTKTGSASVN